MAQRRRMGRRQHEEYGDEEPRSTGQVGEEAARVPGPTVAENPVRQRTGGTAEGGALGG
jgi:hypothetical protein